MSKAGAILLAITLLLGALGIYYLLFDGRKPDLVLSFFGTLISLVGFFRDKEKSDRKGKRSREKKANSSRSVDSTPGVFQLTRTFEGGFYGGLIGGVLAGLLFGISYYNFVLLFENAKPGQILSGMKPFQLDLTSVAAPILIFSAVSSAILGGMATLCMQVANDFRTVKKVSLWVANEAVGGTVGGMVAGFLMGTFAGPYFGSRYGLPVPHPVDMLVWGSVSAAVIVLTILAYNYMGSLKPIVKGFVLACIVATAALSVLIGLIVTFEVYYNIAQFFVGSTNISRWIGGLLFGLLIGGGLGFMIGLSNLLMRLSDRAYAVSRV